MKCLIFRNGSWKKVLNFRGNHIGRLQFEDTNVTLPSKVFTFMRKNSPKFSGRITPLTPPMLEVPLLKVAAQASYSSKVLKQLADFQVTAEAQGNEAQEKQNISQAKQIHKLKAKLNKLTKGVQAIDVGCYCLLPRLRKRKSEEQKQVINEEEKDTFKCQKWGFLKELDLEEIQSTARKSIVTPRTLNFDDEAGLKLLVDLTTLWETSATVMMNYWKNQED
ncbi:hypothetical protein Tco_0723709 [Tanacetum coccineum]